MRNSPGHFTARHAAALAAIVVGGFAIRLHYLFVASRTPNFEWTDPDGYLEHALFLAQGPHGWHWTFDAVRYTINGQTHALPPLYSVFLSFVALAGGLPFSAQLAQVLLATGAIALIYALGTLVHSPAAGLWAAGGYAVSVSSIFNVWSTSQEALYIPLLLLAFVLLGRAVTRDGSVTSFAVAGLAFGLAALTRSMPVFFILPAALLHVVPRGDRRRRLRQAAGLLAGFVLLTAPYCVALSRDLGQLTIVDSHGSIHVDAVAGTRAPGVLETVQGLWRTVAASPRAYAVEAGDRARSLLHVNGGRQLQIYVVAANKPSAVAWKTLVHLGTDALLIAAVVLAPLGAMVCRNTPVALQILLWTVINVAIASIGGFGGARLRSPFEPLLMVLGAVVLAGGWSLRRPWALALGIAGGLVMAAVVLPQLPRSLRAWPDYGVQWNSVLTRRVGRAPGTAGFNVLPMHGIGRFEVSTEPGRAPVPLLVRPWGAPAFTITLGQDRKRVWWPAPADGLAYVELRASDPHTHDPVDLQVVLDSR